MWDYLCAQIPIGTTCSRWRVERAARTVGFFSSPPWQCWVNKNYCDN